MVDNTDIIETNILAQEWDESIEFYSQLLGRPKDDNTSLVVFQLPNSTFELRLTKVDTIEGDRTGRIPSRAHIVGRQNGERGVRELYRVLSGTAPNPSNIEPHIVLGPPGKKLHLAYVEVDRSAVLLTPSLECIVHNPDWT